MRTILGVSVLLSCALLVACGGRSTRSDEASRDGSVGWTMPGVEAADRMELAANERFQYPLPDTSNAMPDYPSELLAEPLPPQVVCVSLSVSDSGSVFRVDPMEFGEDCEETRDAPQAMRQAVFDALGFWRFEPAFRCVYPEGVQPGMLGCMPPASEVPTAVRMPYRFVFEQREGRGVVSSGD